VARYLEHAALGSEAEAVDIRFGHPARVLKEAFRVGRKIRILREERLGTNGRSELNQLARLAVRYRQRKGFLTAAIRVRRQVGVRQRRPAQIEEYRRSGAAASEAGAALIICRPHRSLLRGGGRRWGGRGPMVKIYLFHAACVHIAPLAAQGAPVPIDGESDRLVHGEMRPPAEKLASLAAVKPQALGLVRGRCIAGVLPLAAAPLAKNPV